MLLFELFLQSPAIVDIRQGNANGEISMLKEFYQAFELYSRGLLLMASLATFAYMIWGAVDWIMAGGDSGKIESARKKITQAMIGLTVLASVGAIFLVLQYFLGTPTVLEVGGPKSLPNDIPKQTCIFNICI